MKFENPEINNLPFKKITGEIKDEPSEKDFSNLETAEQILISGTPAELEKLRNFYGLDEEKFKLVKQFTALRAQTLKDMRENFKQRIAANPSPDNEEEQMGIYKEELEPQVRDAVISLRRKGYNTFESGFYGSTMQKISFEERPLAQLNLTPEILNLAQSKGLEINVSPDSIELHYNKFLDLADLKEVWDKIAESLPSLGHPAMPASTKATELFQKRVGNIKNNPKSFLED